MLLVYTLFTTLVKPYTILDGSPWLPWQDLVYRDPKGATVLVPVGTLIRNLYKYEPRNLILSYSLLTVFTALAVATGFVVAVGKILSIP